MRVVFDCCVSLVRNDIPWQLRVLFIIRNTILTFAPI
jgi:hypothetical protein